MPVAASLLSAARKRKICLRKRMRSASRANFCKHTRRSLLNPRTRITSRARCTRIARKCSSRNAAAVEAIQICIALFGPGTTTAWSLPSPFSAGPDRLRERSERTRDTREIRAAPTTLGARVDES
jgi:hypothetical protein